MYIASYINRHTQFGKLNATLVLTDDAGLMPLQRQWMKFPDTVTQQQLDDAAAARITQVLIDLADQEAESLLDAP